MITKSNNFSLSIILIFSLSVNLSANTYNFIETYYDKYEILRLKADNKLISGLVINKYYDYEVKDNIISKFNYKDGKLDGNVTTFFESGNVNCSGLYKDNELFQSEICYYKNGMVLSRFIVEDGKKIKYERFSKDGNYSSQDLYAEDGTKYFKEFRNNGLVWVSGTQKIVNETLITESKYFDTQGQLTSLRVSKDLKPNELCFDKCYKSITENTTYYANGQIKQTYTTLDGMTLHGLHKKYYDNGKLESIKEYKAGKKVDISKKYDKDNKFIKEKIVRDN